ncbi:signal peptidase I [Burkholderia cenocepacia]|uniref:signal peptidase I n=1 Tax=Burkholderia cenocepacia TaxID=95486 RepID=UPI001B9FA8C5|nr:signal peptidase I [Burkholderia cenocepacia]MBR8043368.1 signal peptidase I [Burkholderia cenocepacia]MBR8324533.1 signal peptidase I [Burkholderia cenocepacia]
MRARNLVLTAITIAVMVGAHVAVKRHWVPHIFYEAQSVACLPWDFYFPHKAAFNAIRRGDIVWFRAEGLGPRFKDGTPMAKLAAALPGDRILILNSRLYVNGKYWGSLGLGERVLHKPPGYFDREFTVGSGELFVLGTEPRSFDSRYWGVIHESQIQGTLSVLF